MSNETATPAIHLHLFDGKEIVASSVMLYPSQLISKAAELTAGAHEELKAINPGIGFVGSPEWAIGGSLAVGLISGLMSNAKAKRGVAMLQEAQGIYRTASTRGLFFPCSDVSNIERPFPQAWRGIHFDIPFHGAKVVEAEYVALDNDMMLFEVGGDQLWVRMSSVSSYAISGMQPPKIRRAVKLSALPKPEKHDDKGSAPRPYGGGGPRVLT